MKSIFIFPIFFVVSIAIPSESDPRALQVAQDMERRITDQIIQGNADGIASLFSEHLTFEKCNGRFLDREDFVRIMLMRQTEEMPRQEFVLARDLDNSTLFYELDEHYKNQQILSTYRTVEYIDGKWIITTGQVTGCKE